MSGDTYVVTVEFRVTPERAPDLSGIENAREAVKAALAECRYAPNGLIRGSLTNATIIDTREER